ncbi:MAG: hypothetical protein ACFFG0_17855 [Candidatus Thorarchaeota archaeon]
MEKNNELKGIFRVVSSQKWYKFVLYAIFLLLPGISLFIYFIYIPPVRVSLTFTFIIIGLVLPPILYIIFMWIKERKKKSKLVVSNTQIEFYWLKHLFMQIDWFEITSIKIYGERWRYPSYGTKFWSIVRFGFTLQFLGPNLDKTVRLWCFPFNIKKQGLIISGLLKFSEKLDVKIEIDESNGKELIVKPDEPLCPEFLNFYKNHKHKKKS